MNYFDRQRFLKTLPKDFSKFPNSRQSEKLIKDGVKALYPEIYKGGITVEEVPVTLNWLQKMNSVQLGKAIYISAGPRVYRLSSKYSIDSAIAKYLCNLSAVFTTKIEQMNRCITYDSLMCSLATVPDELEYLKGIMLYLYIRDNLLFPHSWSIPTDGKMPPHTGFSVVKFNDTEAKIIKQRILHAPNSKFTNTENETPAQSTGVKFIRNLGYIFTVKDEAYCLHGIAQDYFNTAKGTKTVAQLVEMLRLLENLSTGKPQRTTTPPVFN